MNNTVSPKQVLNINTAIEEVTANTVSKIADVLNNTLTEIGATWADTKAVAAASKLANMTMEVVKDLEKSCNNLEGGVVNVANRYARVAGKATTNAPYRSFNAPIISNAVHETFGNSDEYGFKGKASEAALKIANALGGLSLKIKELGEQSSDRINSINAFGNPEIKVQILKTSTNYATRLGDAAKRIEKFGEDVINQAAKDYDIGDVSSYFSGGSNGFSLGGSNTFSADSAVTSASSYDYQSSSPSVKGVVKEVANDIVNLPSNTAELAKEAIKNPGNVVNAAGHVASDVVNGTAGAVKDVGKAAIDAATFGLFK